ncbi:linear amide C-N hydrolase [Roseicella aquatilis]|uniref:Linear amide C-N hydrolase n=1 Tax=Roseicella aquatilis TaxID=2527868 RepID=A0A4R4D655_9PROT|nr:linear amide C-N hydrolase [Roseicella aquatilis]
MTTRLAALLGVAGLCAATVAAACTRATYLGPEGTVITARSMDWSEDTLTDLWAFPRGLDRNGGTGERTLRWRSRYGSLVASAYDAGSADGMNERGLVANLLYLAESDFGEAVDGRPTLSVGAWPQYVLDNFATVAEAVEALRAEPFRIIGFALPNGRKASLHLAISDASGDSAVVEYLGGKLTINHGRDYQVMTNSPVFADQLALTRYWEEVGGMAMLPGTIRAADRFVRASYYTHAVPQTADARQAVASMLGVIRNVSVPYGITTPDKPNIASTLWRTVADQKTLTYYFDNALTPNVVWVRMAELNLAEGQPVRRAGLRELGDVAGSMAGRFQPAQPYEFRITFGPK